MAGGPPGDQDQDRFGLDHGDHRARHHLQEPRREYLGARRSALPLATARGAAQPRRRQCPADGGPRRRRRSRPHAGDRAVQPPRHLRQGGGGDVERPRRRRADGHQYRPRHHLLLCALLDDRRLRRRAGRAGDADRRDDGLGARLQALRRRHHRRPVERARRRRRRPHPRHRRDDDGLLQLDGLQGVARPRIAAPRADLQPRRPVRQIGDQEGLSTMQTKAILPILGIVALAIFPFAVTSPYSLLPLVVIAIYSVLLLGLDIVFGYTGEVSIGHAALFGVGAYTAGVLKFQCDAGIFWQPVCDAGFFAAAPLGIAVAALFGLVLALPALRVTGPYLAMVTLAFGTIVQILVNEMTWLTNGPLGVAFVKPLFVDLRGFADTLPFLDMNRARMLDVEFYYLAFIVLLLVIGAVNRLLGSHIGRAFQALRDSPIASDCMGVSVYRHKVYAFVVSAGLAGLAGGLFAYSEQYIAPNNFGFELSITFLLAVTISGRKSRPGPIIGAVIVVFLPNLLADIDLFRVIAGTIAAIGIVAGGIAFYRQPQQRLRIAVPVALCIGFFGFALLLQPITAYRLTVFGMMILFVVYYLPDGIYGFLRRAVGSMRP